jgi:hypothetical protein
LTQAISSTNTTVAINNFNGVRKSLILPVSPPLPASSAINGQVFG